MGCGATWHLYHILRPLPPKYVLYAFAPRNHNMIIAETFSPLLDIVFAELPWVGPPGQAASIARKKSQFCNGDRSRRTQTMVDFYISVEHTPIGFEIRNIVRYFSGRWPTRWSSARDAHISLAHIAYYMIYSHTRCLVVWRMTTNTACWSVSYICFCTKHARNR